MTSVTPLRNAYQGRVSHPDLGSFELRVQLASASKGTWTATGALGEEQTRPISIVRKGAQVVLSERDETVSGYMTQMDGAVHEDGHIEGVVIQNSVRGGSFSLTPTAGSIDIDEKGEIILRLTISFGKWVGGTIRFMFEDIYNGACQLVYLCKMWDNDEMDNNTKAFMILSIAAGVACSLVGPIQEFILMFRLRSRSEGGTGDAIRNGYDLIKPVESRAPLQDRADHGKARDVFQHKSLAEFLFRSLSSRSRRVHRVLLMSAIAFWGSNAVIYFALDVKCGGGIPKTAWMIFFSMTTLALIVEIWALVHTENGYLLFKNCRVQFMLGVVFGNLGRFDTFGDVTNTLAIRACTTLDPEHYSWFSIRGHRFNLPADLGTMMIVGLLMIVALQTIPGLLLFALKKWGVIALKMNEFCIILNAIEAELKCDEEDYHELDLEP